MEILKSVAQHGTVALLQHVFPNVHVQVRIDSQDVLVVGGVVDLAERETVPNLRDAGLFPVRHDMRRIQQFAAVQTTERAALAIGPQNAAAEAHLVKAPLGGDGHVAPPGMNGPGIMHDALSRRLSRGPSGGDAVIRLQNEGLGTPVIAHDMDPGERKVDAPRDADEVEKGPLHLHQGAQPHVVRVIGTTTTVAVEDDTFGPLPVVIWRRATGTGGSWRSGTTTGSP